MVPTFDVFLSHNSRDKPMVRELAEALRGRGLRVWFDEWELVPGRPWQEAIEEVIETVGSAAVLVGKDGLGPWEIPEMRACLSECTKRGLPVIPVLLPGAPKRPRLPLFLKRFTWVDLRGGLTASGLDLMEWGITGRRPSSWPVALAEVDRGAVGRIEIPELLPYMSDRSRQRDQLADALGDHRRELPRRPLAVLIHGDEREAHGAFIQRLQRVTLPRLLGLDPDNQPVHRVGVPWVEPAGKLAERRRQLLRRLSEKLTARRDATWKQMAEAVAGHRCPMLISTRIPTIDWCSHEPELVRAWLAVFAGWAPLAPGQALIVTVSLLDKEHAASGFRFWKRKAADRTAKLVEELREAPIDGLGVVALDRLEAIREADVMTWIEEHAGQFAREAGGAIRDPLVLAESLKGKVRRLFSGAGRLPMEALAPELRAHLSRCLNQ